MEYSAEDFVLAYQKWVNSRVEFSGGSSELYRLRNEAWDNYCDVRDGLKPGTSRNKRLQRESAISLVH